MNNDNEPDDAAIQEIDALIGDIQGVVEGKSIDHVMSAFSFILAENVDHDEEAANCAAELTLRILRGYAALKRARKMQ